MFHTLDDEVSRYACELGNVSDRALAKKMLIFKKGRGVDSAKANRSLPILSLRRRTASVLQSANSAMAWSVHSPIK